MQVQAVNGEFLEGIIVENAVEMSGSPYGVSVRYLPPVAYHRPGMVWRYSAASGWKLAIQNPSNIIFSQEDAWFIVEAIREVGTAMNCGRFFREVGGQRIYMAVMLLQTGEWLYATWPDMEAILGQPPAEGQVYDVDGYNGARVILLGQGQGPVYAAR
ncbi:MAG: hypothetical protein Q8O07_09245 [Chloroflexota bacterium]|nr:hypothetical protein [Chloroflexota bacterium]